MGRLALVRDEKFRDHLTPEMHPESPRRLVAIDQALTAAGLLQQVNQLKPRQASEDELCLVHSEPYIDALQISGRQAKRSRGLVMLDPDTWMSADSYNTATLAAGAGLVAAEAVSARDGGNSFVVVRPPGHHALSDRPMGFCLFNNIALTARYAQKKLGYQRILIIDWDVHHGNGTQAVFYGDPTVLFISLHQFPFWPPNSGWYAEDGHGEGKGYNVNIPLPAGTGDRGYLKAWCELVRPLSIEFQPDLILLSAGYDAHLADPLAQQGISTPGYAELSRKLLELALDMNRKIVAFLEGGYNAKALSDSVLTTMRVLNADSLKQARMVAAAGEPGKEAGEQALTSDAEPALVDERIQEIRDHFSRYWQALR